MALSKSIDTDIGAPAAYWRITRADFNLIDNTAWYALSGYVSKAARDAGKGGIVDKSFSFPLVVAPEEITRAALYANAKTREEFADAVDA
jgi:hypothetical protein